MKKSFLQIELAAVVDGGKPFVQSTYKLESDGALAFECYEIILSLTLAVTMAHYPNVQAVTSRLAGTDASAKEQLVAYANSCIKPALDYYRVHLNAPMMSVPVSAFKAARLLYSINQGCIQRGGTLGFPPPDLSSPPPEIFNNNLSNIIMESFYCMIL